MVTGETISGNFYSNIGKVKSKSFFLRQTVFFQPEVQFHDHPFKEWKLVILAQVFLHDYKLEVTHRTTVGQALIPADNIHFFISYQVFHHFPEHQVDPGLHPESEAEIHPYYIVRDNMFHHILTGIWVIDCIDMYKPVNVGPFGFPVQDGINDLMLNFLGVVGTGHINQVRGILWNRFIITEFLDLRNIVFKPYKLHIAVFDFPGPEPDIHNQEQEATHYQGYITAMREFFQVGKKEAEFNGEIHNQVDIDKYGFHPVQHQEIGKENRGGNHT